MLYPSSMSKVPVILQVLPRLESGGVERGTVEITEAIAKAGMKPIVASQGGTMAPKIARAGGVHVELPLASKNPLVMYRNMLSLYRLIKTHGVSLVHARSRAPAWSAYYAAKKAGVPFITTFHGVYSREGLFKIAYNRIMVHGERVIAVSQFVKDHLLREYHVPEEKICLIPRGVELSQFDESVVIPDRVERLIRAWRLPDEELPIIFCPGRITPIKGQSLLIDALTHIKDMHFLCVIAGNDDGHEDYMQELRDKIIANGLEGKVRITGSTPFMAEALTLSSVVVVPSIKPESFGRVAIEAQAMRRLVIATDHGGARETIIQNETGYLVPPGDAQIMAEAIRYALTLDKDTLQAMGDYARDYVRYYFSSQQMKDKTIALYREILKNHQNTAQF